jgi:hypothetical protein
MTNVPLTSGSPGAKRLKSTHMFWLLYVPEFSFRYHWLHAPSSRGSQLVARRFATMLRRHSRTVKGDMKRDASAWLLFPIVVSCCINPEERT